MRIEVFISYSRKDRRAIATIAERLGAEFKVWWDRDLISGQAFGPEIFQRIDKTDVALVCVSEMSVNSKWVEREAIAALNAAIVIPVRLDDTPLPKHLAHLHAIDLRPWMAGGDNSPLGKAAFATLLRDVRLHVRGARGAHPAALQRDMDELLKSVTAHLEASATPKKPGLLSGLIVLILAVLGIWLAPSFEIGTEIAFVLLVVLVLWEVIYDPYYNIFFKSFVALLFLFLIIVFGLTGIAIGAWHVAAFFFWGSAASFLLYWIHALLPRALSHQPTQAPPQAMPREAWLSGVVALLAGIATFLPPIVMQQQARANAVLAWEEQRPALLLEAMIRAGTPGARIAHNFGAYAQCADLRDVLPRTELEEAWITHIALFGLTSATDEAAALYCDLHFTCGDRFGRTRSATPAAYPWDVDARSGSFTVLDAYDYIERTAALRQAMIEDCFEDDATRLVSADPNRHWFGFVLPDEGQAHWWRSVRAHIEAGNWPAAVAELQAVAGADANAAALLATIRFVGADGERDLEGAIAALVAASRAGSAVATANLGIAYALGVGVEMNTDIANVLIEHALRRGLSFASVTWMWHAGMSRVQVGDFTTMFGQLRRDAASGNAVAQAFLALYYNARIAAPPCDPECDARRDAALAALEQHNPQLARTLRASIGDDRSGEAAFDVALLARIKTRRQELDSAWPQAEEARLRSAFIERESKALFRTAVYELFPEADSPSPSPSPSPTPSVGRRH